MDADSQEETERSPKAQRLSDGSRSRAGLRANGSINGSLDGSLSPETDGEDPLTLATAPLLPAPLPAATAAGTAGTAAAPAASPATDPDEDTDYADEHDEDDDEEEDARPQGAVSQHLSLSRYLSYMCREVLPCQERQHMCTRARPIVRSLEMGRSTVEDHRCSCLGEKCQVAPSALWTRPNRHQTQRNILQTRGKYSAIQFTWWMPFVA